MFPTYHLSPNFSLGPPDRGGELDLGMIIDDLKSLGSERPLNIDCHLSIDVRELYCDHKKGFTSSRAQMERGEYGIWAKFAAQAGIGGELSWATERTANDTYQFKALDTIYFNPTRDYLHRSINLPDVNDYVVGSGYKPVYMITGLKIARGPAVQLKIGRSRKLKMDLGLKEPGGLTGLSVGPTFHNAEENQDELLIEESEDFIIGFRVKRLYYKRWCFWKPANLVGDVYNKGATMLDSDGHGVQTGEEVIDEDIAESDDEMTDMIVKMEFNDGTNQVTWIVSNS
ncbi:hypothetical protein BDZ45DRAFT_673106 [Acephala macrosclerotiorum]|nr:hypothetical protein BDZ45DRAFT_673106 [Acephala macrosclerotiorum]